MAKLMYGSIDFSKLIELAKTGNKAFSKASNGKIYLNLNVWINDEKDKFGNDASIQTNFKDAKKEDKHYFGNLKVNEIQEKKPINDGEVNFTGIEDLPF